MLRKFLFGFALSSVFCLALDAEADLQWRCAKTYTATLAEGAKDAVQEVGNALQNLSDAKEYIDNAQTVVDAAKYAAPVLASAKAVAAAESASALLGTASEAIAGTMTVVVKGAAVAGAAAAGTLVGQGANWFISLCWDPVCEIEAVDTTVDNIYTPVTDEEVAALIPEITSIVSPSGEGLDVADFEAAGEEGTAALQFLSEGIKIFLNSARGAAAAADGRYDETLNAVDDLTQQLANYPTTIYNFASVVQEIVPNSPFNTVYSIKNTDYLGTDFQVSYTDAIAEISGNDDDPTEFMDAIGGVGDALGNALDTLSPSYPPLVTTDGTQGAFSDLTLDGFNQFVNNCSENGSGCLPAEETSIVNRLLTAARVTIPGIDIGTSIADYDASDDYCDDSGETAALQLTADLKSGVLKVVGSGALTLADVLSQSCTNTVTGEVESSWMGVDLEDSPVTIAAREAAEENGSGGCSLAGQYRKQDIWAVILIALFIVVSTTVRSRICS